ncbi:MAG: hypothetical protein E7095_08060 [Bacteroides sp.]|nr:hypothetical protein [Bacteroides sp.]
MKSLILKAFVLMAVLSLSSEGVMAQGFLKKLKKSVESVTSTSTSEEQSKQEQPADSVDVKDLLANPPAYSIKKVVLTDENGEKIMNEDGTVKYHYLVIDDNTGKACTAEHSKKIVNARLKSYGKILAKVGSGAAIGALGGLLQKDKKAAIKGAAIGAATGILASGDDIKQIKKLNKSLKAYKKQLEIYQKTFTEEGTPIDASINLADVEGIDFTEAEVLTKSAADVRAELAESNTESESLEDVDLDEAIG